MWQVRQHVEHKRTFFYLEQLILKHNADASCLSIKEKHEVRAALRGPSRHACRRQQLRRRASGLLPACPMAVCGPCLGSG